MKLPKRKSPRLPGFDYSSENYYYVTICTHNRKDLFGMPDNLTVYGEIAEKHLLNIEKHYDGILIDKYVIMPNHIHAIIVIGCDPEAERSRPFPTLDTILGLYKSGVSREIHQILPRLKVWQKSYFDKIIRNKEAYLEVYRYIEENPIKWIIGEKEDY
ncbi:MAG: transposase [Clostridia bacterium]|nr:transposase [Clostridia bacterium]